MVESTPALCYTAGDAPHITWTIEESLMPHSLLLTGRPGVGKTTLIQRVLAGLPGLRLAGFATAEIRDERGRLGFRAAALDGPEIVLAHVEKRSPYRVGKYGVDVAAFERAIVPLLDVRRRDVDLFVVDEIGKMECFAATFVAAVEQLLADPRPFLGTIALRGPAVIATVRGRPDVVLREVTRDNRDALVDEIVAQVRAWLEG
ncbi:MAG: nucleoside triphosphatase [Anaerolineae bacterium]|nr:nucleoside triphosphatase [Anaerolineae bacterium]